MKKYLLLRDNHQSGPHTFQELISLSLLSTDLIWIEAESTCWKFPDEIEELKDFVSKKPVRHTNVFVELPSSENIIDDKKEQAYPNVSESEIIFEDDALLPMEELKENYSSAPTQKEIWHKRLFPSPNLSKVVGIFLGVAIGAFVIKKLVDGYTPNTIEATATAIPIVDRENEKPDENFKNAIVTEVVPVYKTEKKASTKPKDIKKQLLIKNNQYKVGLFGGVNGLQLTLFNTSALVVDKVVVAVDYLKPNGAVVQSENVVFSGIKPKASQTISIPGSNRGVKVKYKILKVTSHQFEAETKNI